LSELGLGKPQSNFGSLFTTADCTLFPGAHGPEQVQTDDQGGVQDMMTMKKRQSVAPLLKTLWKTWV